MNIRKIVKPLLAANRSHLSPFNIYKLSPKEPTNSIWKELKIEALKDQIECNLKNKNPSINFQQAKSNTLNSLIDSKNFISRNAALLQQNFPLLQITQKTLIQQIQTLIEAIDSSQYKQDSCNMHTSFYSQMNKLINQPQKDRLALILQTLIKAQHSLVFLNQCDSTPNLLNSHPSLFKEVWAKINVVKLNEQKIAKEYSRLDKLMKIGIGILCQIKQSQNAASMLSKVPYIFARGLIRYKKKLIESLQFYKNPSLDIIQKINNLQKSKLKHLIELTLPRIKSNLMIYIPSRGQFKKQLNIFKEDAYSIPVKILYNKEVPSHSNTEEDVEQALLHIHGGGFVLFSSFVSQNHTRYWAKQSNKLIFTIDYKLAPKYPFPQGLYDCLQVYRFLTEQIHKYFRINLKRIYLCGDSAGGNLSSSLTGLIMKQKLRIPQGLFLIYPSLDLRKVYYPSRKYSFSDLILNPSFVNLCISSYLKTEKDESNPLASPILITQQFIGGAKGDLSFPKTWPKTYIIVGTKDPLRDESLLLMQKMVQSKVDCECILYQGLKHGFMNTEHFISQSSVPWKHSLEILNKMFYQKEEKSK